MSNPPTVSIGETFKTNEGYIVRIIEYINNNEVLIEFNDERKYKRYAQLVSIRRGSVKNPYHPNVQGIGYLGDGDYTRAHKGTNSKTIEYQTWQGMLERCYDTKYLEKFPTYIGCSVCEEWLNFQNFAEWYTKHKFYSCGYQLDKDLLVSGNKIYSPSTCTLLPQELNSLLTTRELHKGLYPTGVTFNKKEKKFKSQLSVNGRRKCLGTFNTAEEASNKYLSERAKYLEEKVVLYKGKIEPKAIKALVTLAKVTRNKINLK